MALQLVGGGSIVKKDTLAIAAEEERAIAIKDFWGVAAK